MELPALRFFPDPVLRAVAEPVAAFDRGLLDLTEMMIAVMLREGGIGLAAPQVGAGKRVIVATKMKDVDDTRAEPLVLVNPVIINTSKELWSYEEGCLSVPGVSASVMRSIAIEAEYRDIYGDPHRIEAAGMFARVIQHEVDHIDGRLFIDYLSSAQKSLIKPKLKKLTDEYRLL
jgi:peptide deformylase